MNPKLITWDYGKEINLTLEDALISLESLRFMLGGAIHRPSTNEPVIVRHTEEVVVDSNGKVPLPKDHLTGVDLIPEATTGHPIRLINLTTGVRTQITSGKMSESGTTIKFKNTAAGVTTATDAKAGEHIRIFWEEVIENDTGNETAVEVTISPDTFPGTLIKSVGLLEGNNKYQNNLVNCWKSKCFIA